MLKIHFSAAALVATLLIAGCSWDEDVVPVMTGQTMPAESVGVPHLPHGGVTAFESTGTPAGEKAAELRGQLAALQGSIDTAYARSEEARGRVAADLGQIKQAGAGDSTTARDDAGTQIATMSGAASEFTAAKATAADLLSQTRDAYNMDGVTDEDRRQLSVLEGEVNRTAAVIDQTLSEMNSQIADYDGALSTAQGAGAVTATADMPIAGPVIPASEFASGAKPFVTIRFDQPDVAYRSELSTAIHQAIQRRPGATYDVVAVTPNIGSPADVRRDTRAVQKSAHEVLQFLTSLGIAPGDVTLSATTSGKVDVNQVQIFVR
jgi:hypothetical protein